MAPCNAWTFLYLGFAFDRIAKPRNDVYSTTRGKIELNYYGLESSFPDGQATLKVLMVKTL